MKRGALACLLLGLTACGYPTLHGTSGRGGDVDVALERGVGRLLDQSTVSFQYSVLTATDEFSVTMSGTVHLDSNAWIAKGRLDSPAAGSAQDFELRSIGRSRWLGLTGPGGARTCWVDMAEDRELEGLPAIDAGVPGFVMVMEQLHAVDWQLGEESQLTARLALQDAALLASTFELTSSELAPPAGKPGSVAVTVGLEDGVVHDLLMTGTELAAAFAAADASIPEKAARDLETRDVRLSFDGPTLPVKRPDPSRVFDGVHRLPGCPEPEPQQSDV
jgi:hypothetical protein